MSTIAVGAINLGFDHASILFLCIGTVLGVLAGWGSAWMRQRLKPRSNLAPEQQHQASDLAATTSYLQATLAQKERDLKHSEELFGLISENAADLIAVVDANGDRIYNSPSYQLLLGYSLDELKGTKSYQQVHPDDQAKVIAATKASLETGVGQVVEYRMQHKDGNWLTFESSGSVFHSSSGEVEGIVIVAHDITKRKQVEDTLKEREAFLRLILDNIPQGIYWKDRECNYLGCNLTYAKLVGLDSPESIVGKTDYDMPWSKAEAKLYRNTDREVMESSVSKYHVTESLQKADGRRIWVDTSLIPLHNTEGDVVGILGTYEDVTERKEAEAALQESEERFRTLAESTFEGIMIHDQGKILDGNSVLSQIVGCDLQELIGLDFFPLVAPEYRDIVQDYMLHNSGNLYEIVALRQNGERYSAEIRAKNIRYQGKSLRVAAIRDITQRKEAEAKLQELNAYLNAIIDNLGDGLLAVDLNNRVGRNNPALVELFELGACDCDLRGKSYLDIFTNGEIEALVEKSRSYRAEVVDSEIELAYGKIGKAVATSIYRSSNPAQDCEVPEDIYVGTVILIRDVTREKEIDQMKTSFISNISHELRTPLTSILGFAKVIDKKLTESLFPMLISNEHGENPKTRKTINQVTSNLTIIISETQHLTSIVNNVIDIANLESEATTLVMQPLSISEVIENAIAANNHLFSQSAIALNIDFTDDLPQVMGDKARLTQVMVNLLTNAVKFTSTGNITISTNFFSKIKDSLSEHLLATLNHGLDSDLVIVRVKDTGIGISESDQPMVFEKFRQVGDILTNKPQGTGLGLPICKEIIKHHGGQIWLESELGKGSCFSFTLRFAA